MSETPNPDGNSQNRAPPSTISRPNLESQPTVPLHPLDRSRPSYDRTQTAAYAASRWGTAGNHATFQDGSSTIRRQRTERKQEQTIPTENEYYTLNPWHNQPSKQPVFGLAQPLPRTVRKGMLRWGEKNERPVIYKVENRRAQSPAGGEKLRSDDDVGRRSPSFDEDYFSNRHASEDRDTAPGFQIPVENPESDDGQGPQEQFDTDVDGQRVHVRRVGGEEAEHVLRHQGVHLGDSRATGDYGLHFDSTKEQPPRNTFGLQDGLPQLRETTTRGTAGTAETVLKENHEELDQVEESRREFYNTYRNPLSRFRARYPQALAEFLSTFITLFLGLCGNLSVAASGNQQGGFLTSAWAWGMAVMVGIYIGGGVSGAHLNPCISVCLSLFRGFPWRMCFVYVIAQFLAGFCAGGLAWLLFRDSILHFDPGLTPALTGKAFYTLPQTWVSPTSAFFNEFVGAAILVCIVFALGDDQNSPPGAGMNALILGLANFLIVITLSYNTGPAISPARDFGPRLVALFAGYGTQTFTTGWWAYGPWGGGFGGSIVGALLYDSMVFVGGESPVNYRWPKPPEIRWKLRDSKNKMKGKALEKLEV